MMNVKEMNVEELRKLKAEINHELARREDKFGVYAHDCINSAKYHLGKYKHWSKKIDDVDTTKTNGYAFKGDFLNIKEQHKLKINSLVVEFKGCENTYTLYRMEASGKEEIIEATRSNLIELIEKAKEELK
jgi:hypothetical protein